MIDPEWVYHTVRSELIVRIDLVPYGSGGIKEVTAEIIGGREDDDGLDVGHLSYRVTDGTKADPIVFCGLWNPPMDKLLAFVTDLTDEWPTAWQRQDPNLVRIGRTERGSEEIHWRHHPLANHLTVQVLNRIQGAFGQLGHEPPNSYPNAAGGTYFAASGIRDRLEGVIGAALRPAQKATSDFYRD